MPGEREGQHDVAARGARSPRANGRPQVTVWESRGVEGSYRFGERVTLSAWPSLWTLGERTLLQRPLLGLLCSSRCPGDAIIPLYDLARALRDAGVPVVGGFHSPMEKECLDLLLRGTQPVVICPARNIQRLRVPSQWREPIEAGRVLIVSPFPARQKRPTAALAEQRNRLVAELADELVIAHAAEGGKLLRLCREALGAGKVVRAIETPSNAALQAFGCELVPVASLVRDARERLCERPPERS